MKWIVLLACVLGLTSGFSAESVKLLGANGVAIEFAGILKATPKGLVLLVAPDGDEILVDWDKFDISDLKTCHPQIHTAMDQAKAARSDVALRLGVYAGKQSASEFKQMLRDSLNVEIDLELPKMTDFFDDKDIKDGNFNFNHYDDFKFAEKRSARYIKLYTELLETLVKWDDPTFSKSTHTLIDSDGDRNVVITEAKPTRKSAPMKPIYFIRFLAQDNNRLNNAAITLIRFDRDILRAVCDAFEEAETLLRDDAVLIDTSTVSNWLYMVREIHAHFNRMYESKTIDAELDRDLRRLIEAFDL